MPLLYYVLHILDILVSRFINCSFLFLRPSLFQLYWLPFRLRHSPWTRQRIQAKYCPSGVTPARRSPRPTLFRISTTAPFILSNSLFLTRHTLLLSVR